VNYNKFGKALKNHYCSDNQIDELRSGTTYSRSEYLTNMKFPDGTSGLGPSIRSCDFSEILVADYLEYKLGYWVPRTRYLDKAIRNESKKGCDIIGFLINIEGKTSPQDTLAIYEAKAQFSGPKADAKLQEAVKHSGKDQIRKAEALNAIKQRYIDINNIRDANRIKRFQNIEDHPYQEIFGAAALFCQRLFDQNLIVETDTSLHPNRNNLQLIVIHGQDMMVLVHDLYRRAADEA
jgi:hypothetical protein